MRLETASPEQLHALRQDLDARCSDVLANSGKLFYIRGARLWSAIKSS